MKGWCRTCKALQQVPKGAGRDPKKWRCPVCGNQLSGSMDRDRYVHEGRASGLQRDPDKPLRSKITKPALSIAQAMRSRERDWTLARAKVDAFDGCVWASLGGCEGGESAEACHIVGRERDEFPPLPFTPELFERWTEAHDRGVWLVVPTRIVPGCTRHHRLYDDGEIPLLGRLTLEEELQAVADCHTEGTRESGIGIAVDFHLDRPAYLARRAA